MSYDSNHKLTREGMDAVFKEGGSLIHKGNIVNRPEAAAGIAVEMAAGDEKATQQALAGIEEQRRQLDEQQKKLLAENARIAKSRDEQAARDKAEQARQQQQPAPAAGAAQQAAKK